MKMNKINFSIRNVVPEDASQIAEIGIKGWEYAYSDIFSPEYMVRNAQRRSSVEYVEKFKQHIADSKGIKMVAVDINGKILGYKMNEPDADGQWRGGGTYVDPEYIGMGIGRALFVEFARRLDAKGKEKFWVNCLTKNKSMRFYNKLGGKVISRSNDEKYENQSLSVLEFNVKDLIK
jgi:ribosomal protein S18 acetylase RimI-like enzyme